MAEVEVQSSLKEWRFSRLDYVNWRSWIARETADRSDCIVGIVITAQKRRREGKIERRTREKKNWCLIAFSPLIFYFPHPLSLSLSLSLFLSREYGTMYKLIMNDPIENVLAPLEPGRIVSTTLRKKRPWFRCVLSTPSRTLISTSSFFFQSFLCLRRC